LFTPVEKKNFGVSEGRACSPIRSPNDIPRSHNGVVYPPVYPQAVHRRRGAPRRPGAGLLEGPESGSHDVQRELRGDIRVQLHDDLVLAGRLDVSLGQLDDALVDNRATGSLESTGDVGSGDRAEQLARVARGLDAQRDVLEAL